MDQRLMKIMGSLFLIIPFALRAFFVESMSSYDPFDSYCKYGFYVDGFYWTAKEENLPSVQEEITTTVAETGSPSQFISVSAENNKGFKSKWTPGFRIGLDYEDGFSELVLDLEWTHFHNHTSRNFSGGFNIFEGTTHAADQFLPLVIGTGAGGAGGFNNVRSKWRLNFDSVVLSLGKKWCLCNGFIVKPYAGIKYDHIKQKLRYDLELTTTGLTPSTSTDLAKGSTLFQGGGLVLGIENRYSWCWGIDFFGNFSAGVVYGYMHSKQSENGLITSRIDIISDTVNRRANDHLGRVNLDAILGVEWKYCFDCMELGLKAAYEYHEYFNQNFFPLTIGQTLGYRGDLIMQGFTIGVDLNY